MAENIRTSDLRYLNADNIVDDRVDFDGLDVRNAGGEKLGEVQGFIVQRDSSRPYYLVVDSGGWFSSRHYLVPIGQVRFDPDNHALRVDVDRDTIEGFPEVHLDRFDEITEEEARRINEGTLRALAPNEVAGRTGESWDYDRWSYYRQPDWWRAESRSELPPPPLTNRPLAEDYDPTVVRSTTVMPSDAVPDYAPEREHIVARRDEALIARDDERVIDGGADLDRLDEASRRERLASEPTSTDTPIEDMVDRAQPGDVLGIETGGETTGLGDTAHDEDERREDADQTNRKLLDEQRRDRKK